jgi:hypothetical protein
LFAVGVLRSEIDGSAAISERCLGQLIVWAVAHKICQVRKDLNKWFYQ